MRDTHDRICCARSSNSRDCLCTARLAHKLMRVCTCDSTADHRSTKLYKKAVKYCDLVSRRLCAQTNCLQSQTSEMLLFACNSRAKAQLTACVCKGSVDSVRIKRSVSRWDFQCSPFIMIIMQKIKNINHDTLAHTHGSSTASYVPRESLPRVSRSRSRLELVSVQQ